MQTTLDDLFVELDEQIKSFFTRKSLSEGREDLRKHCDQLLKQVPQILSLLSDYPVYGAMAFWGKFSFEDCAEVRRLERSDSIEILQAIRSKKAVKISEEALPGWQCLCGYDEKLACTILCLCYQQTKRKKEENEK